MIFNTAATANKLRNIHEELQKLVDQVSIQNNAEYLIEPTQGLWNELNSSPLKIDILIIGGERALLKLKELLEESFDEQVENFLAQGKAVVKTNHAHYRLFDEDHFPAKKSSELPVMLKLCVIEAEGYELEDLTYFVERLAKETALVAFYSDDAEVLNALRKEVSGASWKLTRVKDSAHWQALEQKLNESKDLVNHLGMVLSYSKINVALEATVENEFKDLSARKISVQNDHMKLKKMGTARVGQDTYNTIKTNLQRSYSSFESGINERFNQLNKNQPGSLYSFMMDQVDGIQNLDTVTKGSETTFAMSASSLADLQLELENGITEHLTNDIKSLNDFLEMTVEEVNQQCKEIGLNGFDYQPVKFSDEELNRLLESQMSFEREHDPKVMKKGIMAYFSAVRQPYMIIIMMASALAPFIGNIREKAWFAPLIAVALITGVYFAIRDTRKGKEQTMQEELKKVRQWLKGEYKRIFANMEREWKTRYFQHAKDQFGEIQRIAEDRLKAFQVERGQQISSETNLTQRKMQNLEAFDKKLNDVKRSKAQLENQLRSLRSELKQYFLKTEI